MFTFSSGWIFALWKDFFSDFYDTHSDTEVIYTRHTVRLFELAPAFPWIKYQFFTNEEKKRKVIKTTLIFYPNFQALEKWLTAGWYPKFVGFWNYFNIFFVNNVKGDFCKILKKMNLKSVVSLHHTNTIFVPFYFSNTKIVPRERSPHE